MASLDDVRRIALSLPAVVEGDDRFSFEVHGAAKPKSIAWSWLERVEEKKGRVENLKGLAIRTASVAARDELIAADPSIYWTEPHYNGFPAVLLWLEKIGVDELEELLTDAWLVQAPKKLVKQWELDRAGT